MGDTVQELLQEIAMDRRPDCKVIDYLVGVCISDDIQIPPQLLEDLTEKAKNAAAKMRNSKRASIRRARESGAITDTEKALTILQRGDRLIKNKPTPKCATQLKAKGLFSAQGQGQGQGQGQSVQLSKKKGCGLDSPRL